MGLDTTHDCWHGAYSAFMRWRQKLAEVAGLPPLDFMEGFYTEGDYRDPIHIARKALNVEGAFDDIQRCLPIRWDALKPDVLHRLLSHSDCEGKLPASICTRLADRLEKLLPALRQAGSGGGHIGDYAEKTETFIRGLRLAASRGEAVEFH